MRRKKVKSVSDENLPALKDKPPVSAGVLVNRRMITWVNGLPVPTNVPALSKNAVEELATTALSLPYEDPLGLPSEFDGMTNAEVMMIRMARKAAAGDVDTAVHLLDRVLGRPKQSVESKSLRLTYEDYLKEMAAAGADTNSAETAEVISGAADSDVVDAEVIEKEKQRVNPLGPLEGI